MKTEVLRVVCLTYPLLQSKGLSVLHREFELRQNTIARETQTPRRSSQ